MAPENGKVQLIVVDQTGRRYSCNQKEFLEDTYDDLIDRKTGYLEYLRDKDRGKKEQ